MHHITPQQFHEALQASMHDNTIVCIDVRSPEEYMTEHIQGVHNIPLQNLAADTPLCMQARSIYVHCLSGGRSSMAAAFLEKMFPQAQVYNLTGGIGAWKQAQLPVV